MNRLIKIAITLSALLASTVLCSTSSAVISASSATRDQKIQLPATKPKISEKRHAALRGKLKGTLSMRASWAYQDGSVDVVFRHEGGANWGELRNGKRMTSKFRETDRSFDSVTLYDESTLARVKWFRNKIERYTGSTLNSTFTGGWHYNEWKSPNGQIRYANDWGKWVEYRDGRPTFTYVVKERNYVDDSVRLFSNDRGVWVILHGAHHPDQPNRAFMDGGDGKSFIGTGTFTQ